MKFKITLLMIIILFLFTTSIYADQLQLQKGESLRGELLNNSLKISTVYAEVNIQTQFLKKINSENGDFIFTTTENNQFRGKLNSQINFSTDGAQRTIQAAAIKSINFSNTSSFNNNKQVSINLKNGDFFFASMVEDSLSVDTSLGSSLNIGYSNIEAIEYLDNKKTYLVRRNNGSDLNSNLNGQKIIIWPAAGEIFELDFKYIRKIKFN